MNKISDSVDYTELVYITKSSISAVLLCTKNDLIKISNT